MRLALVAVVLLPVMVTGCVYEESPAVVDAHITNDTTNAVDVTACYDARCQNHDVTDSVSPGHTVEQAVFPNTRGGIALFRVTGPSGHVIGCLRFRH